MNPGLGVDATIGEGDSAEDGEAKCRGEDESAGVREPQKAGVMEGNRFVRDAVRVGVGVMVGEELPPPPPLSEGEAE